MAKFNAVTADNYGEQGGGGFFSLKEDKETSVIRFMYNSLDDIEGFAVHEVEVDGKKRYVNCLREYNDPLDKCPLCEAGYLVKPKLFLNVFECELDANGNPNGNGTIKIWDRGKSFYKKLSSLSARYNPLVGTPFEIERNGARGDTKTTYETYPLAPDGTTLEDLPQAPEILGGLVLDRSFDELNVFLDTGNFPKNENSVPSTRPDTQTQRPVTGGRGVARPAVNSRPSGRAVSARPVSQTQRRTPSSTDTF